MIYIYVYYCVCYTSNFLFAMKQRYFASRKYFHVDRYYYFMLQFSDKNFEIRYVLC